jgi:hypothetical protein
MNVWLHCGKLFKIDKMLNDFICNYSAPNFKHHNVSISFHSSKLMQNYGIFIHKRLMNKSSTFSNLQQFFEFSTAFGRFSPSSFTQQYIAHFKSLNEVSWRALCLKELFWSLQNLQNEWKYNHREKPGGRPNCDTNSKKHDFECDFAIFELISWELNIFFLKSKWCIFVTQAMST